MALLFFDTSALVRRYDATEPGAARVRDLGNPSYGHALFISRVTPVEIASALSRKVRIGTLNRGQLQLAWQLFTDHRHEQYRILALDQRTCEGAEQLTFRYPLRAYDALQIAVALSVRTALDSNPRALTFVTADRAQARAAESEGLQVELIE